MGPEGRSAVQGRRYILGREKGKSAWVDDLDLVLSP